MTGHPFKPGDVIIWEPRDRAACIGVVCERPSHHNHAHDSVWAHWLEGGLWSVPRYISPVEIKLHPDADRIFAEYTAWLLTR